jgi:hypothetical protein
VIQLATNCHTTEALHAIGPDFPIAFDILERPISRPEDIDYFWTEFSVTGSREAIHAIAKVLMRADRIRSRLARWLQTPVPNILSTYKRSRVLQRLERVVGISCDGATSEILTSGDLDVHVFMAAMNVGVAKAIAALPFDLSEDDVNYVGTKGVADWSLSSMTSEHAIVSDILRTEFNRTPVGTIPTFAEVSTECEAGVDAVKGQFWGEVLAFLMAAIVDS